MPPLAKGSGQNWMETALACSTSGKPSRERLWHFPSFLPTAWDMDRSRGRGPYQIIK